VNKATNVISAEHAMSNPKCLDIFEDMQVDVEGAYIIGTYQNATNKLETSVL